MTDDDTVLQASDHAGGWYDYTHPTTYTAALRAYYKLTQNGYPPEELRIITRTEIGLTRAQQLKAIGNGVCPQQAAKAVKELSCQPTPSHSPSLNPH